MTTYICTMPGFRSSSNHAGAFLRPMVIDPVLSSPEFRSVNIQMLRDRDPSINEGIAFCQYHDAVGNQLLLAGKSYGAADITVEVLHDVLRDITLYDRIGLFTVDLWGHRYRNRKHPMYNTVPVRHWFTPARWKDVRCTNVYQRNGGPEGALVLGAKNVEVPTPSINHSNIVTSPIVVAEFVSLLRWAVDG